MVELTSDGGTTSVRERCLDGCRRGHCSSSFVTLRNGIEHSALVYCSVFHLLFWPPIYSLFTIFLVMEWLDLVVIVFPLSPQLFRNSTIPFPAWNFDLGVPTTKATISAIPW